MYIEVAQKSNDSRRYSYSAFVINKYIIYVKAEEQRIVINLESKDSLCKREGIIEMEKDEAIKLASTILSVADTGKEIEIRKTKTDTEQSEILDGNIHKHSEHLLKYNYESTSGK